MADSIKNVFAKRIDTPYAGLNAEGFRIGKLGFIYLKGTATSAIPQWAYFNIQDTVSGSNVVLGSGVTLGNDGNLKFTSAVASGAEVSALIVYIAGGGT